MMQISEWLGLIGGIAGLIVLLTGALVYVRGSYSRARIDSLSEMVDEYVKREALHEKQIVELTAQVDAQAVQITALENENKVLTGALTQKAQVAELKDILVEHHTQALEAWHDIVTAIKGE